MPDLLLPPAAARIFNENDRYLFLEGTHTGLADVLGAHLHVDGTDFAVWAPQARAVSVIGTFNDWQEDAAPMQRGEAGIWHCSIPQAPAGSRYKYRIESSQRRDFDKADPLGFFHEQPPGNASLVWDLAYKWGDREWMGSRRNANSLHAPMSIYEVHGGSWRKPPGNGDEYSNHQHSTYEQLRAELIPYVKEMGFTHVQFLPVMEHPFYGSWGYQTTGYYAPTSRYGTPQQFMRLIDELHQHGIGVILDWVPSHFPQDGHSLGFFDGVHEYEPADPRRGLHPDWNSFIFNYARGEVRSFLLSSALFWLDRYHADGLRVDAVASMLYLDYSRRPGEWIPNEYGSRENLDAIGFLRRLNEDVYREHPDAQTFAEESTAWPLVSKPTYVGGLGFGLKWDMGWMHDTLQYMQLDPVYRKYHHSELTFRSVYAFSENFVLPLSHDEVVYGKGSLLEKMPGDAQQKFAGVRLLLAYMYAQPGKKLLFMGCEFAQTTEWNHDAGLPWQLLKKPAHAGIRLLVGDLNSLYRAEPALHFAENAPQSFAWIDAQDSAHNVISFLRNGREERERILIVCNFSAVPCANYQLGVPHKGFWQEQLNTDAAQYGGAGCGNFGGVQTVPIPAHGHRQSLLVNLPPLAALYFRLAPDDSAEHTMRVTRGA